MWYLGQRFGMGHLISVGVSWDLVWIYSLVRFNFHRHVTLEVWNITYWQCTDKALVWNMWDAGSFWNEIVGQFLQTKILLHFWYKTVSVIFWRLKESKYRTANCFSCIKYSNLKTHISCVIFQAQGVAVNMLSPEGTGPIQNQHPVFIKYFAPVLTVSKQWLQSST
jgi:hypothetical protein